jgi:predicted tellurium resistance membrane protein TerC
MKNVFKNQESSLKMRVLSIILLIGFALFSALVFAAKISINNLIIYLIAFAAYIGFSLLFISSLSESNHSLYIKKRMDRHS